MSSEKFGTNLRKLLDKSGVEKIKLAPDYELPPKIIKRENIPEEFRELLISTLLRLRETGRSMPFLHITSKSVTDRDGKSSETKFVDDILEKGLSVNTNGAGFVTRSVEKGAEIATPSEFMTHPEDFLDDLYQILKKYSFHGKRTNKRQLLKIVGAGKTTGTKDQRHTAHGKGDPVLIATDITEIPVKRGVDGDEHYIILNSLPAKKVIGVIDITDSSEANDISEEVLLEVAKNLVDKINIYLDVNSGQNE